MKWKVALALDAPRRNTTDAATNPPANALVRLLTPLATDEGRKGICLKRYFLPMTIGAIVPGSSVVPAASLSFNTLPSPGPCSDQWCFFFLHFFFLAE